VAGLTERKLNDGGDGCLREYLQLFAGRRVVMKLPNSDERIFVCASPLKIVKFVAFSRIVI
jgi:hypothetical protein